MMRTLLLGGFLAAAAAAAVPAHAADTAFPGGSFGEREGCRYAQTGESSGADSFLLLNAEGITTSVATCALRKVAKRNAATFDLTIACESEGESGGDESARATLGEKGWTIQVEDGTVWGPLAKCN